MRIWIWWFVIVLAVANVTGCRTKQPQASGAATRTTAHQQPTPQNPIVTLSEDLTGKVARVNDAGKFVVIIFPVGQLPRMEQRLGVYRDGLKVGDVKITGPQLDDSVVADIVSGEVRDGDTVKQ